MKNAVFRTLVTEFYRQNSGFFLILLLLGFGIIRSDDHIALFRYALAAPAALPYYFALWALYALKTSAFARQQFREPSCQFLYHLRLYPSMQRYLTWWTVQLGLLAPLWAYGLWMCSYADGQWLSVALVLSYLVALTVLPARWYEYLVRNPVREARTRKVARNRPLPVWLFFFAHLFRQQPLLLVLTKLFSGVVLIGVCLLYPTDDYDERLLAIGALIGGLAHLGLAQEQYVFEHRYLLFLRNLPRPFAVRFGTLALEGLLLFLPETLLLARYLPEGVSAVLILKVGVFYTGLRLAALHRFYVRERYLEQVGSYGLWGFILGLVAIMFRLDIAIAGLALWGYAAWVSRFRYFASESAG
ncbi:MAG: hypothetical protein J7576_12415 [Siphonobacter aquaeclarae]|nr:hypothetical protein [Siphonobacter aquaeclarae]